MLKAALHVHSTYSDGEFTLRELREKFVAVGCRVVCMADHADAFDTEKLSAYVDNCRRLSDGEFLFVPGLEFGCVHRMHIVGYGVVAALDSDDPETVINHIRAHQGVAVIAHPPHALFPLIENFAVLPDGIEGWNSKYDGRYAPRPATFDLIQRLQDRHPPLRAYYGQDLHWRRQYAGLFTMLDVSSIDPLAVRTALLNGNFEGVKDSLRLPANGQISTSMARRFARINARSGQFRSAVRAVRKMTGGLATHLPSGIKTQLRRLF